MRGGGRSAGRKGDRGRDAERAAARLDEACTTWHTFLDDYMNLSTARGDEHFEVMRTRIAPYGKNRSVRELGERARTVAALKGWRRGRENRWCAVATGR